MTTPIQFYNSLTQRVEVFNPITPQRVTMYVCGPTIYDYIHIGNARPIVVFDVLYRLLKRNYPKVTYVRNITDIDDKIIKRADEMGCSIDQLVTKYLTHFYQDISSLNVLAPTVEPKATEHMSQMIALIEKLIQTGHAYTADNHVLFSVQSSELYGNLSRRKLEDMQAGARVEVASYKKHPLDFVLWKPSAVNQPAWDSPWGKGRPGWHLECSAMASHYLGEKIDIHGGGRDLLFPHHENERIQSCCAFQQSEFSNYWLHNGYVTMEGEKMSKSVGNTYKLNDLLKQYSGEVIRFLLLSTHYTKPLECNPKSLQLAHENVSKFYAAFHRYQTDTQEWVHAEVGDEVGDEIGEKIQQVEEALKNDLNTPAALTVLHQFLHAANKTHKSERVLWLKGIITVAHRLGLFVQSTEQWYGMDNVEINVEWYLQQRDEARKNKNYGRADEIRDHLLMHNVVIEDSTQGTSWKKVSPHNKR